MNGDFFDQLLLFRDFSPTQLALLKPLFVPCEYLSGDFVFDQGNLAENLYILAEGEVLIRFKPDDGPALTVARLRPEGVVGWSAALGSPTYTSSAVCSSNCRMLRIRGEDLRDLCRKDPQTGTMVLERLAAVIAERLRNTHEHVIALLEQGLQVEITR